MTIENLPAKEKTTLLDLEDDIIAARTLSDILIDFDCNRGGVKDYGQKASYLIGQIYDHLKALSEKYQEVCQNQREATK